MFVGRQRKKRAKKKKLAKQTTKIISLTCPCPPGHKRAAIVALILANCFYLRDRPNSQEPYSRTIRQALL